jgi:hypothetical protein
MWTVTDRTIEVEKSVSGYMAIGVGALDMEIRLPDWMYMGPTVFGQCKATIRNQ